MNANINIEKFSFIIFGLIIITGITYSYKKLTDESYKEFFSSNEDETNAQNSLSKTDYSLEKSKQISNNNPVSKKSNIKFSGISVDETSPNKLISPNITADTPFMPNSMKNFVSTSLNENDTKIFDVDDYKDYIDEKIGGEDLYNADGLFGDEYNKLQRMFSRFKKTTSKSQAKRGGGGGGGGRGGGGGGGGEGRDGDDGSDSIDWSFPIILIKPIIEIILGKLNKIIIGITTGFAGMVKSFIEIFKFFMDIVSLIKIVYEIIKWLFEVMIWLFVDSLIFVITFIFNIPSCFLWYIFDFITWVFYFPILFLSFLFDSDSNGRPIMTVYKKIGSMLLYIDGVLFSIVGFHIFHYPDNILVKCYPDYPPFPMMDIDFSPISGIFGIF